MGTSLIFAVGLLVLSGLALCSVQRSLNVYFHMNGVTGTAAFNWTLGSVAIAIRVSTSLGSGQVRVEIKPFWVDYDVQDKCSTAQLGDAMTRLTTRVTFINNAAKVVFRNVESLASLGGYSILLNGSEKHVCASIESEQKVHDTAVAQFKRLIQGTVYFRQSINGSTRIVADLYSSQSSYFGEWFIVNPVVTCPLDTSPQKSILFNPTKTNGNGCTKTTQESCAVGQLLGKHGRVLIGGDKGENKIGYTDNNLPSIKDLNGMLLVIKTSTGDFDCAVINVFTERKAIVEFNHDGVTGSVTFSQPSPFDPTTTSVNFKGLNYMAKGYNIYLWPTAAKSIDGQDICGVVAIGGHFNPFNKIISSNYPKPKASTDDMYEVGDLSSKYGPLDNKSELVNMYTDWNLPLYGSNSIIGRSMVIHRDDAVARRWMCANIEPYAVIGAIAVLKYPVIGQIMFMQKENQSTDTSIFVKLDYSNGQPGTKNHQWGIGSNMVTDDMISTGNAVQCFSTGAIYDPRQVSQFITSDYSNYCSKNKPLGCQPGDLSGRLGLINVRDATNSDTATRHFFTDVDLPLSGPYSIIGKSVFIMNKAGNRILACANIHRLHEPYLIANFSLNSISGSVSFRQKPSFGATKTAVINELTGLENSHRLFIYELPPAPNSVCSDLGSVFNPFNIEKETSQTDTVDKYRVGDLAHFEIWNTWSTYNLPLTGLASINQRSLVVVEQDNRHKVVACAKIVTAGSSPIVEAVSTFTGAVTGTIHLFQTINEDGTMSDTSILVDLKNQDDHKSQNHNWHEHSNPVQGDVHADEDRCNSAKGHMDPYMTKTNMDNYKMECRLENPLRCEMGDQSSKLGTYNIGEGRKMYTDVDLPLSGKYSGLGKSMVVHKEGKVLERLACADILPVISDTVIVEIENSTNLDRLDVAQVYANAIMVNVSDIVVELISESNGISTLRLHFIGVSRAANKDKFVTIVNSNDKSSLAPYIAYINAAFYSALSTALMLTVFAVQLLNYL